VATYRITYEGPSALALETATKLAEADGIELTASLPPQRRDDTSDAVVLVVTVDGTPEAVSDAMRSVGAELADEATLSVDPNPDEERSG
jgi:hypothetical protein